MIKPIKREVVVENVECTPVQQVILDAVSDQMQNAITDGAFKLFNEHGMRIEHASLLCAGAALQPIVELICVCAQVKFNPDRAGEIIQRLTDVILNPAPVPTEGTKADE